MDTCENCVRAIPGRQVLHRHEFYEVFWFPQATAASNTFHNDFRAIPLVPGTLIFVSPGQVHTWEGHGTVHGTVLCFRREFLESDGPTTRSRLLELPYLFPLITPGALTVPAARRPVYARLCERLQEEYGRDAPDRLILLRATLEILLVEARRDYEAAYPATDTLAGVATGEARLTRRFLAAVEERFLTQRAVAAYATALNTTARRLGAVVAASIGRPPAALIRERVLLEAKRLLHHSDLSVSEIAHHLSFDDRAHFGRFFRGGAGCAPGAFRARQRLAGDARG